MLVCYLLVYAYVMFVVLCNSIHVLTQGTAWLGKFQINVGINWVDMYVIAVYYCGLCLR
jgi:hypothetical protein